MITYHHDIMFNAFSMQYAVKVLNLEVIHVRLSKQTQIRLQSNHGLQSFNSHHLDALMG